MIRQSLPPRFRDWPLAAKVMLALAATLLPPGIVAVVAAWRSYSYALTQRPRGASTALSLAQALSISLPILMWLAALGIGWIVANSLIVRPLTEMRDGVETYARGDKSVRLHGGRFFSREVAALADAFDALADDIATHDAEMDAALAEQKRLTREVHHRVKNNLQIVSSLLSLQSRDAASLDVAHAYAVIQARVSALAIVHRWMYESDSPGGTSGIDLKALTTDLAAGLEQSLAISQGIGVSITPNVPRLFVSQDTAVPLAFLVTELISCAAEASAPGDLDAHVTAKREGDKAMLTVAAPAFVGPDRLVIGAGHPSARIVSGMARQLRSPMIHDVVAGSYCIAFPLPAA